MKSIRNITLLFHNFEEEHFGKDVFLLPHYLKEKYQTLLTIVVPCTSKNKKIFDYQEKNVTFRKLINRNFRGIRHLYTLAGIFYLIRHSKKIDLLISFHFSIRTAWYVLIYKLLNPKGQAYIKLDIPIHIVQQINHTFSQKTNYVKLKLFQKFIKHTDLFSCETSQSYLKLQESNIGSIFIDKLILMPNGFDERKRINLNIRIRRFEEKENIILTVGRIGNIDKNNEQFLKALTLIKCKNWKFYFVGSIEEKFMILKNQTFDQYPHLKDMVIFTGPIFDKKELWELFNRSKVFVFTSWRESYGLVLNEAFRFNNYIISTDVGAAKDIIKEGAGTIVEKNNEVELSHIIEKIINNEINIQEAYSENKEYVFWDKQINKINLL